MKSQIRLLAVLLALSALPVYAAYTETGSTAEPTVIEKVTVTVKNWYNAWRAPKPVPVQVETAAQPQNVAPANTPVATSAAPANPEPEAVAEVSEQKALREQPLFEHRAEGSTLKDVQSVRDSLKGAPVVNVAAPGRKGTSNLDKTKAGVPAVNWKKIKVSKIIPRLDIGTENRISANDFKIEKLSWGLAKPSDLKRLPSPAPIKTAELAKALSIAGNTVKANGAKGLQATIRTVGKPVTMETVAKIQYVIKPSLETNLMPYKPLTEDQLKMVAALILFEKGNHCHMIMGLFNQLKQAANTKMEATYHLGACADQLKMEQAAYDHLSAVVKSEDRDFAAQALALLATDLPAIYEQDFYRLLKGVKGHKGMITEASMNDVAYRMAKGAYRSGDFKTSIIYADQVTDTAKFHEDARFLSGMNSFALGEKAASLKKLQALWTKIEGRKLGDSKIRALTSINLARMYFAQKKYDKALEHYLQVPKDHALWVQALIEQGWTQLAINDFSGAIGNMYSLHSPYFKAVYQPESFVVRTIGYLNICQYGDAYKTLSWLEKDYREWFSKTDSYVSAKHTPLETYNTVKAYIRGKSSENLEGVPFQVWREMARRKDFLNLQTALNEKQDETRQYEGVNQKIKTEKASIRWRADQAKRRFEQFRAQLAKVTTDRSLAKNLDEWQSGLRREKDLTIGYRYQLAILEQSRQGYLDFQKTSQKKLDTETASLTTLAGQILLKRAQGIRTEMARVLENNEFLRYEVFAGSGENIRYQVAGGEVSGENNRVPAHIRPTKMMNWSFDGEFWEDEIGSYRSSLHNACPASAHGSADRPQTNDQAGLTNN